MYQFPIGVILESFRTDRSTAIKKAAAIGANGIQMHSTYGENAPENLSAQARKDLLREVKDNGLVFSALCGDLGHGFGDKERNPQLIEKSKAIIDLAKELETNVVTTHIGVVPDDPNHDRYKIMQEACFALAAYADSVDAHFAIEPLTWTPPTCGWSPVTTPSRQSTTCKSTSSTPMPRTAICWSGAIPNTSTV